MPVKSVEQDLTPPKLGVLKPTLMVNRTDAFSDFLFPYDRQINYLPGNTG
ncbi:MAG: hypothetical protein WCA08_22290 [Desulfoferrobacter sp.]